jgi:hypothetical protein
MILAAGFAVAARNWWIVAIMFVMFAAIYVPVIMAEETFLRHAFPEYPDYSRRVPRFVPRLTVSDTQRGQFSAALYRKHREYNALLGCLVLLAILALKLLKPVW